MKEEAPRPTVGKLALTRTEAAEALGISTVTLDRLARRGLITPCRATRKPIYAIPEIQRFLRETTDEVDFGTSKRKEVK